MTFITEIGATPFADLIKQVRAGNEVLLMEDNKLVARIVPAEEKPATSVSQFTIRSIKGPRVLTPVISQSDLAEDLFRRE